MGELARFHLEQAGVAVVGGFLQPSSDEYLRSKVGDAKWAMPLADRIATCELAAQANASEHEGERWIHAWCSGQTNGFAVPDVVGQFLNVAVRERSGCGLPQPIDPYMVCGADLVLRCGGWERPINPSVVVVARPGIELPQETPSDGWHVAMGDTKPVSSTRVREAIRTGQWESLKDEGCDTSVVEYMRARYEAGSLFAS